MSTVLQNIRKGVTIKGVFKALDSGAQVVAGVVANNSPYGDLYKLGESIADARNVNARPIAGKLIPVGKLIQPKAPTLILGNGGAVITRDPFAAVDVKADLIRPAQVIEASTKDEDIFTTFLKYIGSLFSGDN